MKVAIISDIHDNLANLAKCLKWCRLQKIEALICCGDVTNIETIKFISDNYKDGEIYMVKGNCALFEDKEVRQFLNIKYFGQVGRFELGHRQVGICHEPFLIEKVLEMGECDVIFYGHTHKPWEGKKFGTIVVNPGTLGGVFQLPTFAFWDTDSGELKLKMVDKI